MTDIKINIDGEEKTFKKDNVEKFVSLMLDGVRPIPQIQQRMWDYIHESICEDEQHSKLCTALATELGWVMGLDEDEMDALIHAECIKSCVLEPSVESYYKKTEKRNKDAYDNMKKRKEKDEKTQ